MKTFERSVVVVAERALASLPLHPQLWSQPDQWSSQQWLRKNAKMTLMSAFGAESSLSELASSLSQNHLSRILKWPFFGHVSTSL